MKGNNFSIVLTGEDFIGWVTLTRKLKDKHFPGKMGVN